MGFRHLWEFYETMETMPRRIHMHVDTCHMQYRKNSWNVLSPSVDSRLRTVTVSISTPTAAAKSWQSCPTLCNPIDSSPQGSAIPGTLQARTLEWVAISFSNAWKWKVKVKSLSCLTQRPHGLQPTRLLYPWDFPGKSTGVGCHCLLLPVVGHLLLSMNFRYHSSSLFFTLLISMRTMNRWIP